MWSPGRYGNSNRPNARRSPATAPGGPRSPRRCPPEELARTLRCEVRRILADDGVARLEAPEAGDPVVVLRRPRRDVVPHRPVRPRNRGQTLWAARQRVGRPVHRPGARGLSVGSARTPTVPHRPHPGGVDRRHRTGQRPPRGAGGRRPRPPRPRRPRGRLAAAGGAARRRAGEAVPRRDGDAGGGQRGDRAPRPRRGRPGADHQVGQPGATPQPAGPVQDVCGAGLRPSASTTAGSTTSCRGTKGEPPTWSTWSRCAGNTTTPCTTSAGSSPCTPTGGYGSTIPTAPTASDPHPEHDQHHDPPAPSPCPETGPSPCARDRQGPDRARSLVPRLRVPGAISGAAAAAR